MSSYTGFSKIYDELINEDIDYQRISDFILSESRNRGHYLDLGCGTGNLSSLVGPSFKETYLVDLSSDMLTEAEEKFTQLNIPHESYAISMTEIGFRRKFDLITSSIDAINYLLDEDEVQELFRRVNHHLSDEGVFIFDVNSPYKIREVLGNNDYVLTREDLVYTWENFYEDDVVEMVLNFFIRKGRLYERIEEVHEERAYEADHLSAMLREAGFHSITVCEDYTPRPVTETTERITFIVRKR